jgi:hypothetical protein
MKQFFRYTTGGSVVDFKLWYLQQTPPGMKQFFRYTTGGSVVDFKLWYLQQTPQ